MKGDIAPHRQMRNSGVGQLNEHMGNSAVGRMMEEMANHPAARIQSQITDSSIGRAMDKRRRATNKFFALPQALKSETSAVSKLANGLDPLRAISRHFPEIARDHDYQPRVAELPPLHLASPYAGVEERLDELKSETRELRSALQEAQRKRWYEKLGAFGISILSIVIGGVISGTTVYYLTH